MSEALPAAQATTTDAAIAPSQVEADAAITSNAPKVAKPAIALANVPTLATTEDLLAKHFGLKLPDDLRIPGMKLNLAVHMHDGKENLNITFITPKGLGINATDFAKKVHEIVHEIPAFAKRLNHEEGKEALASISAAETPQNEPNNLRFVIKFSTPQLTSLADELHNIAHPHAQTSAEIAPQVAAPAEDPARHDPKPTKSFAEQIEKERVLEPDAISR